jgi:mannan endo-1,4-beta-mannosidase
MKDAASLVQEAVRRVAPPGLANTWIRCAPSAPYFETEAGTPWTPVGHNEAITWPHLEGLYRRRYPARAESHFAELAASGVTCLRLMLDYSQVRHRHLEHRCGAFSPAMVTLWDDLIALGERHGVRFLLTPFDTFFMARRWKTHPYSRHMGGPSRSPRTMFTCADTRAAVINRLRFATARWGHSPAVFGWDLWNEIDSFYAGGDMAATADFVTEVSAALRDEELRLHGRAHLQTVSVYFPVLRERPALADIIFRHPALDFASVHLYEKGTIDAPRRSLDPADATIRLMAEALAHCPPGRPLLDTEHGPIHGFKDRRITLPDAFDTECFRRTQWAHLASGGAGGGMRWPYRHPHVLLPAMHDAQAVLADFLPLIDWHSFYRRPLGKRLEVHDFAGIATGCGGHHQAIVCLMADEAHCGKTCRIEISDVAPGCYVVTQMNTVTGERETSQIHTRQDGTLVVVVISTAQDIALAITRAPEGC